MAGTQDEEPYAERTERIERPTYEPDDENDDDRYRRDPRLAQEERFGGMNFGAAFFGWLVAVAMTVLLTALVAAVAAAVGVATPFGQSDEQVRTMGVVAAVVLLVVLMLGYYSGGYVAGRMSRFSGPRQGLGVWVIGLLVTIVAVGFGAVFGQRYGDTVLADLPKPPVALDTLTTAGVVAVVAVLIGTLLAALAGGSVGTHYHRRVDREGLLD